MYKSRHLTLSCDLRRLLIAGPWWGPAARAGSITYDVTVDTSSLASTTGGIQFTLTAGNSPAPLDTATITAFTPQAGLVPPPTTAGGLSGDLTGTMIMDNQNPSLFFETLTYASALSFQVTLSSTPGTTSSPDTLFAFYLFDSSGNSVSGRTARRARSWISTSRAPLAPSTRR